MAHFAEIDQFGKVKRVIVVGNADTSDASGVEKEHIGAAAHKSIDEQRPVQISEYALD